jgi:two-component system, cell cycle sensor histidine kinase PleC
MSYSGHISNDKNIVDRRRKTSDTSRIVRDLRRRIGDNPCSPEAYERDLLRSFSANHRNAFATMPVFIALVALIAATYIGIPQAAWWFAVATLSHSLLAKLCSRYLRESTDDRDDRRWRRIFLLAQLLVALAWCLFALYECDDCVDPAYSIAQFSIILVFQAITMMLSYGFGASMLLTSAPPTLALAIRFVASLDPAHLLMAAILLCSQIFFYVMADRFKLSLSSILAHQSEKETLIAELETARSISEEARRRAEEANLAKSRFLATMSHELRTPLNAILGFSEVMQGEVLGPIGNDAYKDYVNDINESGKHLLKVINEILDLSRIEAGRHELTETSCRLVHVVDEARHMVEIKAKNKNISLITQFEEGLPPVWADERAVRQISLNLLSNALKFTPSRGTIWLKVGWTSSGGQYIAVKDSGPGIAEEEIPIVLSSFGQGSIAIKSAEQGTGLGLPIVQALMHMHDGRFELRSKLREGTEAIAAFPRKRVLEPLVEMQNDSTLGRKARSACEALRSA